jgi:hypothetical protein
MATRTITTKHRWKAVGSRATSWDDKVVRSKPRGPTPDVMAVLTRIMGYDLLETQSVAADHDLYFRATTRLRKKGKLIPAEEVLGDLDEE